jgi:hypothetical protein
MARRENTMAAEPERPPELLIVAAFSRHASALAWARQRMTEAFGPIALASQPYAFVQTDYYAGQMGRDLQKQLLAFARLSPPDCLAAVKQQTIRWENELAQTGLYAEPRPINLDPGLLNLGKFMLATTKDQGHRLYLGSGIFGEVTLRFCGGRFESWPWTYADYRLPQVHDFLQAAREYYRQQLRDAGG